MRVKIIRKNFGGVEFTPEMRVLHGTTVYNIAAVLPDNRRTEIVLMCAEVSNEQ